MDKKLEARIAKLERVMSRKFEAADDAKNDEKAWKAFDDIAKERMANERAVAGMMSDHEDGGYVFEDIKYAAEQLMMSDLPEVESLGDALAKMADKVEKLYMKVKAKTEELKDKEEQMRVDNGWTKKAVKERIKGIRGW